MVPSMPGGTRSEVSRTSRDFSPKIARSEEHTSELQSRQYLHSFPTRRSSDLDHISQTNIMAFKVRIYFSNLFGNLFFVTLVATNTTSRKNLNIYNGTFNARRYSQ